MPSRQASKEIPATRAVDVANLAVLNAAKEEVRDPKQVKRDGNLINSYYQHREWNGAMENQENGMEEQISRMEGGKFFFTTALSRVED